jgi:circadian clock protein KaiC
MSSSQPEASNAREVLIRLKELVEEHRPRCLVIDPLSALTKAGGRTTAVGVVEHLLQLTKSRGITVVCTSLSESPDPQAETTALQVSTVADTWIHLSYAIQAGERNRALTIIKSRGMAHSNQVRELILASRGITLSDVYTAGGQVLMGTLRWERERAEQGEHDRLQADLARKQREIELARAELNARMEALQRELAMKQADLDLLLEVEAARRREVTRLREGISIQRGGRAETGAPLRRNGRVRSKP